VGASSGPHLDGTLVPVEEPSTWGNRGSESPLNLWLFVRQDKVPSYPPCLIGKANAAKRRGDVHGKI
jgi:hypothetical protein